MQSGPGSRGPFSKYLEWNKLVIRLSGIIEKKKKPSETQYKRKQSLLLLLLCPECPESNDLPSSRPIFWLKITIKRLQSYLPYIGAVMQAMSEMKLHKL